jgi:hypothetical protein
MRTAAAASKFHKSSERNHLAVTAPNAQLLASKLTALRAAVRRQPRVAAGVISYWLGKESN